MKIELEGENALRYALTIAHVIECEQCQKHFKEVIFDKLEALK